MRLELADTEWSYLAALIDGEGCISARQNNCGGKKYESWFPLLRIGQRDHVFVLELYETYGKVGRLRLDKRGSLVWTVSNRDDLKWIISHVLPYLRLKLRQAEVALRLMQYRKDGALVVELSSLKAHRKVG